MKKKCCPRWRGGGRLAKSLLRAREGKHFNRYTPQTDRTRARCAACPHGQLPVATSRWSESSTRRTPARRPALDLWQIPVTARWYAPCTLVENDGVGTGNPDTRMPGHTQILHYQSDGGCKPSRRESELRIASGPRSRIEDLIPHARRNLNLKFH